MVTTTVLNVEDFESGLSYTYSLTVSSFGYKTLCRFINFLVLWSICLCSYIVHFKTKPEYLTKRTVHVFIILMRFLLQSLIPRRFLVLLRYSFLFQNFLLRLHIRFLVCLRLFFTNLMVIFSSCLPSFCLPSFCLPFFRLPSFCLPFFCLPSFCLPSFRLPFFCLPSFRLPSFCLPFFCLPSFANIF